MRRNRLQLGAAVIALPARRKAGAASDTRSRRAAMIPDSPAVDEIDWRMA
ncbi:hypothetical protein [Novosphingobium sp. ERN07]|nr:hypothetical protein [Novosphingobium sp. ERN07]